ncbi:MAG: DNA-binding response regulator [Caldilineae bacterium]|nr:MAG: DNA-binding response regulator [Caldilineae bacterium]
MTPEPPLRVLIVAGDPLARAGLAALLADRPDCRLVGQVGEDEDLAAALALYRPDVVVWDWGWEAELPPSAAMADAFEDFPVVVLLSDTNHVREAWAAGARGLLSRRVAPAHLMTALRAVAGGLVVLDSDWADVLRPPEPLPFPPLIEALTPREPDVLQLLAQGLSNRAIAYRLDISQHTVKTHVNAIITKLGAQNRTEAAVRATQMGLTWL